MKHSFLVILAAIALSACGRGFVQDSSHTVGGETIHRILFGIDIDGMQAVFQDSCTQECDDTLPGDATEELYQQCVSACVAEKSQEFLDMLAQFQQQLEQQEQVNGSAGKNVD